MTINFILVFNNNSEIFKAINIIIYMGVVRLCKFLLKRITRIPNVTYMKIKNKILIINMAFISFNYIYKI